ncbi:MAG TPA: ATP-binding protein [Vicinamibacterales bacterium]|nr:ATP-binding protein [Vicinamibacterales bacterium]
MSRVITQIRPIARIAIPVAVAAGLIALALINVFVVYNYQRAAAVDDGVLWTSDGAPAVSAREVFPGSPADQAGVRRGDTLLAIDQKLVESREDVAKALASLSAGGAVSYTVSRGGVDDVIQVRLALAPGPKYALYYSLAVVGIFGLLVGASVRLRRPTDPATLLFFWLTVAYFGVFAFTSTGEFTRTDRFFWWADAIAMVFLPPLFLHFALVFPERPQAWIRTETGRRIAPAFYLPALAFVAARLAALRWMPPEEMALRLGQLENIELVYLSACLLGGLTLMISALSRLRSMTARRQLRWIVWGSGVGAVPFVLTYAIPFLLQSPLPYGEYSSLLLGCIPLAFASAIVRYRLMDIEVIIKRALVVSAVGLVLVVIYQGTLALVGQLLGTHRQDNNSFWALFATLVVVLVAPRLWNVMQGGLDRLYYRDRYDYRRALVTFARELNSDLDLERLSTRLVERVTETLAVDQMALLLTDPAEDGSAFVAVASSGVLNDEPLQITRDSALGQRLLAGQTVSMDDPQPLRRIAGDEGASWRGAGWHAFVPCVTKEVTIGVLAVGRRARLEPLSSEDMALLGAVASQAATALENARLYGQLRVKADEIERLRQFSDSVVESLSDGLFVIDLDDRVLRWNRALEQLFKFDRSRAIGRRVSALFPGSFVDLLMEARRDSPGGATLLRAPLTSGPAELARPLLVNAGIAPFQTADGVKAGWIVVIEDVTDRASLEEQLRVSEKMAAIGLLAAGVAHEVNTPLTGISSFTQMLLDKADPEDPKTQLLEKIERQTFRAAKIVNSLLNMARPSDGETGRLDVNVVIGDVLSLLEHQFRNSRIQVRRDLAPIAPIRGFEYQLQQVFLNLFLNARDAMPKGGWLSVSSAIRGDIVQVEVADTGSGIPSEHISRIYDPFFTTKVDGRGTGLGLSVTYGIVQEHQGTLSCESVVGQGTRFTLTLPAAQASSSEARAQ